MVDYIRDAHQLALKVQRFMFAEATNEALAARLQAVPGIEAELLSQAPDLFYAYRDVLDEDGIRLMGELWTYANEQGWSSIAGGPKGSENRAEQIIRDARKDLGELKGSVDAAAAPAPLTHLRDGKDWRGPVEEPGPVPVVDPA